MRGSEADDLVGGIRGVEEGITADIQGIGDRTGGRLRGLDFRVKSESSTARKIAADLRDNPALSVQEARDGIYDALRYTYEFDPAEYTQGVRNALEELQAAGYEQLRFKDYWNAPSGYTSFQGNWKAPDGTIIELQFHTPASLAAKDPSHLLYEEWRVLPKGHSRRDTLQAEMDALWNPIRENPPPGVGDF